MTSGPTIQGSLHLHHVSSLPTLAICRSSSLGSVVCSSLAPGSRITWLGSIDLQCTVLVLSLFHERFLDSHLNGVQVRMPVGFPCSWPSWPSDTCVPNWAVPGRLATIGCILPSHLADSCRLELHASWVYTPAVSRAYLPYVHG